MSDEREAAEFLAKFLTQPDRYGGKSPVIERVEVEIRAMTTTLAKEVVAETPALADVIRSKVRDVIQKALREDTYLNRMVTDAVAKTLTQIALEGANDDDHG